MGRGRLARVGLGPYLSRNGIIPTSRTPLAHLGRRSNAMTQLTNISEEASLVLVSELIAELERLREKNGQPSLVAALKATIAQTWIEQPDASPSLRVGMADAQLVLEWVEERLTPEDKHFGDLVAGRSNKL